MTEITLALWAGDTPIVQKLQHYYHERGWTVRQIAEEVGLSPSTVHLYMKKHKISFRRKGRRRQCKR